MRAKRKKGSPRARKNLGYFKWQFLLRNKRYQQDYDLFCQGVAEHENEPGFEEWRDGQHIRFEEAWGILEPEDYQDPEAVPDFGEKPVVKKCSPLGGGEAPCSIGDELLLDGPGGVDDSCPHFVGLQVNLEYTKKRILRDVERIVEVWKGERKRILRSHGRSDPAQSRARLKQYGEYLEVFDGVNRLRAGNTAGKKKPFAVVAKRVYRADYRRYRREEKGRGGWEGYDLAKRAKMAYNECRRLVEGGYRYLTE